jgi:hypothetical protein
LIANRPLQSGLIAHYPVAPHNNLNQPLTLESEI